MAVSWRISDPPVTLGGAVGDVVINSQTSNQFRYDGTAWIPLQPDETRGDVILSGGATNLHLAKNAARSFDTKWVQASEGLVFAQDYSGQRWEVQHRLGSRFVHVLVVSPGGHSPTAAQTIVVPRIEFDSTLVCFLNFVEPVSGTALVRR